MAEEGESVQVPTNSDVASVPEATQPPVDTDESEEPNPADDGKSGDDKKDDDSEDSGKDSIESDESSFHASDYEDEAGYDPDKDPTEMISKATSHKEEGNSHFKSGDLVRASRSYKKGASLLKPLNEENAGDEQVKALLVTLQTNLSMCCLKQNKPKLSLDVASKALEVDSKNVKAYYRRAMAHKKLGDLKSAKRDLREALKVDPSNSSVKKELHAIVKYLTDTAAREKKAMKTAFSFSKGKSSFLYEDRVEADRVKEEAKKRKKKEAEELLKKRRADWEDECVKRMANNQQAISFDEWDKERRQKEAALKKERKQQEEEKKQAMKAKRQAEEAKEKEEAVDEELTESELSQLRGYKKTKDGRITSYFTREQSEKDEKMLASSAPKRLETGQAASPAVPSLLSSSSSTSARDGPKGSAWNQAGTWEERDTTDWCKAQLKSRLLASSSSEGSCIAIATKVEDLTGDASVAIAGKKKRYIFDFHCKLEYEIRDFDVDEVVASGTLHLPDINSATHEEVEVNVSSWTKSPSREYQSDADACQESLVAAARSSVVYFVSDFNEKY